MVWAGFGNGGKTNLAFPAGQTKANDYQDWRSILDFSAEQCYYSCCKLHLGMFSAEWGIRNGLASKFAGLEPHGKLWAILCRLVNADGKQYTDNVLLWKM